MAGIYPGSGLTITDSGYKKTDDSDTKETDIVNNGSAITIYDVEVTLSMGMMVSTKSVPGKIIGSGQAYSWGDADVIGANMAIWTVRGSLDLTNSTDVTTFGQLCDLNRTKGYKTLGGNIMVTSYTDAGANAYQLYTSVPTVKVRIKDFTAKQIAKNPNIVDFNMTMIQDKETG